MGSSPISSFSYDTIHDIEHNTHCTHVVRGVPGRNETG
jgi:hypothetical protein